MKFLITKQTVILIGLLIGSTTVSKAQQDKHFSMFEQTKMQLNPAAAGFFEGDYRLFTNFRNQWMTLSENPFRTISAAFDTRFEAGNGILGTGISFYNDLSGDALYSVTQITVPINYAVSLNRTNKLSFGLAPAFYQRSLKNSNVTWDNQWTGIEFNNSIDNHENLPTENLSLGKFDLAAGIYLQSDISKTSWFSVGVSAKHLTKQKVSYYYDENGLYRQLAFSFYGNFNQRNSNFTLKPNAMMFFQGPNSMYILGSGFDFLLKGKSLHTAYNKRTSIEFGTYYRINDAFILNAIFHMSGLSVGASFDINTSLLNNGTGGFGAMEFFLSYKLNNPRGIGAPSIH